MLPATRGRVYTNLPDVELANETALGVGTS